MYSARYLREWSNMLCAAGEVGGSLSSCVDLYARGGTQARYWMCEGRLRVHRQVSGARRKYGPILWQGLQLNEAETRVGKIQPNADILCKLLVRLLPCLCTPGCKSWIGAGTRTHWQRRGFEGGCEGGSISPCHSIPFQGLAIEGHEKGAWPGGDISRLGYRGL